MFSLLFQTNSTFIRKKQSHGVLYKLPNYCAWGLFWGVFNMSSVTPLRKLDFPLQATHQSQIATWLDVGLCVYSFMLGFLSGLNSCRSCACCFGLFEFLCASAFLGLENDVSLESSTTCGDRGFTGHHHDGVGFSVMQLHLNHPCLYK